jgi:hypothetical protein
MKFSHLVQINDPFNPLIEFMSREQLWRGLVLRAEDPREFVLALDAVHILKRGDNLLQRELHFGNARIRDTVRFDPMQQVRYDTEASEDTPAASLVMRIEEPERDQLFVRFEYETLNESGRPAGDDFYSSFLKNAYMEADVDTIYNIRRLVAAGKLPGGLVH